MIANYLAISGLNTFVLLFMFFLVKNNNSLEKTRKNMFLSSIILFAIINFLEAGTVIIDNYAPNCVIINQLFNCIGFSISPFLPLIFANIFRNSFKKNISIQYYIPCIINAAFCLLSPFFGFIFFFSDKNEYLRGPLFFIYILCVIWSIAVLFINIFDSSKFYPGKNKYFVCFIFLFIVVGSSIQIIHSQIHTTWISFTFALCLLYAFICENNDGNDVLTSLKSRRAYEMDKARFQSLGSAFIIMMDIDDFKMINDKFGHYYGDCCLNKIGRIINSCFGTFGNGFRIGGDEFCVICDSENATKATDSIAQMINMIEDIRKIDANFPLLSYGYSIFNVSEDILIDTAIQRADTQMYSYKRRHKS